MVKANTKQPPAYDRMQIDVLVPISDNFLESCLFPGFTLVSLHAHNIPGRPKSFYQNPPKLTDKWRVSVNNHDDGTVYCDYDSLEIASYVFYKMIPGPLSRVYLLDVLGFDYE